VAEKVRPLQFHYIDTSGNAVWHRCVEPSIPLTSELSRFELPFSPRLKKTRAATEIDVSEMPKAFDTRFTAGTSGMRRRHAPFALGGAARYVAFEESVRKLSVYK